MKKSYKLFYILCILIYLYIYSIETHITARKYAAEMDSIKKAIQHLWPTHNVKSVLYLFDIISVKIRDIHTDSLQHVVLIVFDTIDTIGGYQKYKRGD